MMNSHNSRGLSMYLEIWRFNHHKCSWPTWLACPFLIWWLIAVWALENLAPFCDERRNKEQMWCLRREVWYTNKFTRASLSAAKVPFPKPPPPPPPPAAYVGNSLGILVNIESRCTRTAEAETAWTSICLLNLNYGGRELKWHLDVLFTESFWKNTVTFYQPDFRLITWKPVIADCFMNSRSNFFTWLHGWKISKVKGSRI